MLDRNDENLDLKKSVEILREIGAPKGFILECLASDGGVPIDGIHRKSAYFDWPFRILSWVKTPKQRILVKIMFVGCFQTNLNACTSANQGHPNLTQKRISEQNKD